MAERTIPQPVTRIEDFGLNVAPPPTQRNKRVVVIGTAEDGPMYEPIQIEKPEDAELVWGANGRGDLVRGIFENWDSQTGNPTVVGVRIGNGVKANLQIEESAGTGVDAAQAGKLTSLKLEAKYPGQLYNQVTIGYDDNRNIAIYNPKTGLTTAFTVDTESTTNPNAQVHNVAELVDAINNDPNLSIAIEASYEPIISDYEIAISGVSNGVSAQSNKVTVRLDKAVGYVTTNGFMIENPLNATVTSTNDLIELESVEAVSISQWEKLESKGKVASQLALSPLDGKGRSTWDTIQALKDYNSDNFYMHNPSGVGVVSEYIYTLENEMLDLSDVGTPSGGLVWNNGQSSNTLKLTVPLCLDDSEMSGIYNGSSGVIARNYILADPDFTTYHSTWSNATCRGIETKLINNVAVRPSGLIKLYVSDDSDPTGYWQELPYDSTSGIYLSGYLDAGAQDPYQLTGTTLNRGIAIFAIGSGAKSNPIMRSLVDASGVILPGKFVKVTANTIKGFLGEVENLNALYPSVVPAYPNVTNFFVRGQEIVFNTPPPFDMIVNYGTRVTYEVGSTVNIDDISNGVISFSTEGLLPGPGGKTLANDKVSYLRFRYTFMPSFPAITSAAKSLSGGTNGTNLNGLQRYNELSKALNNLVNYSANIWLPMSAFIDSTAIKFNPITGLREEVNVGFHKLFEDFLEDQSINNIQPHAILGVTPINGKPTQAIKDQWVDRLVKLDIRDPNRAANVMQNINTKFISVVAFEPIFLNIGRGRPYSANGQAAYAGNIASLPYHVSPMNKPINGIDNLRFTLSDAQYEALNDARYVTMKNKTNAKPVIVEDKTAAPYGSDFVNWSTFSITAEAADRVRAIADTFIGQPNSIEKRASMDQLISNELSSMEGLRGFDFVISSNSTQQVLGLIEIDLVLVPIFATKRIRTTVKLRKNLPAR